MSALSQYQNLKDITRKENYRPMSLMNIVTKLLNSSKLNPVYIKIIRHHKQVGCILGLQEWFNTLKINITLSH